MDGVATSIVMPVHVNGNHWIASQVSFSAKTIFYYDSLSTRKEQTRYKEHYDVSVTRRSRSSSFTSFSGFHGVDCGRCKSRRIWIYYWWLEACGV